MFTYLYSVSITSCAFGATIEATRFAETALLLTGLRSAGIDTETFLLFAGVAWKKLVL
jgi:hypothetical protein